MQSSADMLRADQPTTERVKVKVVLPFGLAQRQARFLARLHVPRAQSLADGLSSVHPAASRVAQCLGLLDHSSTLPTVPRGVDGRVHERRWGTPHQAVESLANRGIDVVPSAASDARTGYFGGRSRPRPRAWSARGLRALTAPARSSPDGNYVMAPTRGSSGR